MASCSDSRFLVDGGMIGAGDYDETPRRVKKAQRASAEGPFGPLAVLHPSCNLKEPHGTMLYPTSVRDQGHKNIQTKAPIPKVSFSIVQTCDTEKAEEDQGNALAQLQGVTKPSLNLFTSTRSPATMPNPGKENPLVDGGQRHAHFLDEPETLHLRLGEVTEAPQSDNDCCWDTPRFVAPMSLDVLPMCAGLLYQAKTTPFSSAIGKLAAEDFATPRFVEVKQDIQEFSIPDGKGLSPQKVSQDTRFVDFAEGGAKLVFAEELDLKLGDILPDGSTPGKGESQIEFANEVDLKFGDILPEGGSKIEFADVPNLNLREVIPEGGAAFEFADEPNLKLGDILPEGPLAPAREARDDSILACDSEGADSDFATPRWLGDSHTAEVPGTAALSGSCLLNGARTAQGQTVPACNGSWLTFQDVPLTLDLLDTTQAAAVGQGNGAASDPSSEAASEFSTPRKSSRAYPTSTAFFNKKCASRSNPGCSGTLSDISWFTQSAPTLPGLPPPLVPSLKSSVIDAAALAGRATVTIESSTSNGSIGRPLSRTSASSSAAGQQFTKPARKALGRSASASKLQRAGSAVVGFAPEPLSEPLVPPLAVPAFPSGASYCAARWLAPFAREPGPLPVL